MGLFIEGLKLPKEFGNYYGRYTICVSEDGVNILGVDGKLYSAVEVKEPHGGIIDKDVLECCDEEEKAYNNVVEAERGSGSGSAIHIYCSGFRDGILTMTSKIRFAPTIIEAEGKDDV